MSEETEKDMQDMQANIIEEDVKYRQGRSKYRVEQTEKAVAVCFAIYLIVLTSIWYITHI